MLCYVMLMYLQKNAVLGIMLIVTCIAPIAATSEANGQCGTGYWFCFSPDPRGGGGADGAYLSMWFGFWLAMFVGCVTNLIFSYIGDIIEDTINTVFMCYAIDQDNEAVRPGQLCVHLQEMPQMENPVCVAVAVPLAGADMELGQVATSAKRLTV